MGSKFSVILRSLKSLSICISPLCDLDGFVIYSPSLENFKLMETSYENNCCLFGNMPKLMEAYVDVMFSDFRNLIRSVTSVKHLTICTKAIYDFDDAFVFDQLEHLKFCVCKKHASRLLVRLLKDSPKLRVLDLFVMDDHVGSEYMLAWNPPDIVPECLLSSLRIFKWSGYEGTPEETKLVAYILKNAPHLRTTIILSVKPQVPIL